MLIQGCTNCHGRSGSDKVSQGNLGKRGELCEFTSVPCTELCKSSNFTMCAIIPALSMLLGLILRWEDTLISSHQLLL